MNTPRRTRVAAYGILVESRRLLLCRLSAEVPNHAGKWTLPGGGIEFGEHPEQAMIREFEEESGFHVEVTRLANVRSIASDRIGDPFHSIQIIYFAERTGGTLRFESAGTTDRCEWFPLQDIAELPAVGLVDAAMNLIAD